MFHLFNVTSCPDDKGQPIIRKMISTPRKLHLTMKSETHANIFPVNILWTEIKKLWCIQRGNEAKDISPTCLKSLNFAEELVTHTDIVCSAHDGGFFLQRSRQKQLMTGYFHVPYHGSISERCRWARQSTTRPCSFEQSFIWFTVSLLLVLGGWGAGMRVWWSVHLDHRGKKKGGWLTDR